MYKIYILTNTANNKIYVGKTKHSVAERFQGHLGSAKKNPDNYFYRAIQKYGAETFHQQEVSAARDNGHANKLERLWIIALRSYIPEFGYNSTLGGDGNTLPTESTRHKLGRAWRGKSRKFSDAHKLRISQALTGRKMPPEVVEKVRQAKIGVPLTAKHKENIRLAGIGRPCSEETKKLLRKVKTGVPCAEETKRKISKTLTGQKMSAETCQKMSVARRGVKLKPHSADAKYKMRLAKLGRALPEAQKTAMRFSQKMRRDGEFIKTVAWG